MEIHQELNLCRIMSLVFSLWNDRYKLYFVVTGDTEEIIFSCNIVYDFFLQPKLIKHCPWVIKHFCPISSNSVVAQLFFVVKMRFLLSYAMQLFVLQLDYTKFFKSIWKAFFEFLTWQISLQHINKLNI